MKANGPRPNAIDAEKSYLKEKIGLIAISSISVEIACGDCGPTRE